ncbi:hypothetical protein [Rhodoferax lacus]|uniref:hypothetical protein n=1 Tax=Rhodoferax lacus TaxID=2184758 RepID=UPI0011C17480|nr:hypothetical protein [Rhodoferax lacus]
MRSIYPLVRLILALSAGGFGVSNAQETTRQDYEFGAPAQEAQLDNLRGGFDLVKNDMQLSSAVAGNSAVNVVTGNNTIGDGAFANAGGLPMVIQNSGSNVSIQNATIVNVQLK